MRRASLGQAKFWRKGFNIGHIPLYLGSISDTILDISIVSCLFFVVADADTIGPMSSFPSLLSAFIKLFILTQIRLATALLIWK